MLYNKKVYSFYDEYKKIEALALIVFLLLLGVWMYNEKKPTSESVAPLQTMFEIVQIDQGNIISSDFLRVKADILLLRDEFSGEVIGNIAGSLRKKETDEVYYFNASVLDKEARGGAVREITFGESQTYSFNKKERFEMVIYIPQELENGTYEFAMHFRSGFGDGENDLLQTTSQTITITRNLPLEDGQISVW